MNKKSIAKIIGGGVLFILGAVGLYNIDDIVYLDLKHTKLNKNKNLVLALFGIFTCVGALISAINLDKELYPEVEEKDNADTEEEEAYHYV